ncbi:MAG TPA: DUF4405 domain-containing protein [Anaerolineaceae bacterium]|nr:DUF4405 domain-containing protein [Anaerolineaceae bacterium]
MKINKQIKNWWIDALLMAGYLFCFYLDLTGVAGHQWLGAALTLLALIHLWLHRDWVKAVSKRLFHKGCARNRWYYLLDALIILGFIVILETGLIISTWLNLVVVNYIVWLDFHIYASFITLGLVVVKVGMHWRWVVSITGKIWGADEKSAPVKTPSHGFSPALIKVQTNHEVIDRRRFLAMMGVVSLGSILAVSNVISENTLAAVKESGDSNGIDTVSAAADAADQPITGGTAGQAAGNQASATQVPGTAQAASETAIPATAQPTAQAVAACSVLCPRGCSFPGQCRRYTDQNGNGRCDLGECL